MRTPRLPARTRALALVAGVLALASAALVSRSWGSDHQDTPEVELNPRSDINDVYAFPGASDPANRIAIVVDVASPISPAQTASTRFDANALYQLKIDNTGDGVEDQVIQFVFDDLSDGTQSVTMLGPAQPAATGPDDGMLAVQPTLTGKFGETLGSATAVQLFTGPRDDPFFIDLEQFFKIIPDRRPETGPLSQIGPAPQATAFRGGPTPPFAAGAAVDYVQGFNCLSIVLELPKAMLTGSGDGKIGIWATVSH